MYIIIQTSLIHTTAVVGTHGDPSLADSIPGAENHVMLSLPWLCRTQHLPLPQECHAYRLIPPCLVDLNLAVLILRGHQRILYSLVILGLLSAKNLG